MAGSGGWRAPVTAAGRAGFTEAEPYADTRWAPDGPSPYVCNCTCIDPCRRACYVLSLRSVREVTRKSESAQEKGVDAVDAMAGMVHIGMSPPATGRCDVVQNTVPNRRLSRSLRHREAAM